MPDPRRWSLARQLLALQALVVLVVVLGAGALAYLDAGRDSEAEAVARTLAVATSVADSSDVRDALADADPSVTIQPFAETVRRDTGVSFVTVMGTDRIRFSHPDPDRIGEQFVGTTAPALAGRTFSETYTGTLGPSLRTVAPVTQDGRVVAMVAVGIGLTDVGARTRGQVPALLLAVGGVSVLALLGTVLVSGRLRRVTGGLGPEQLRAMADYYDAVLHSVREGLLVVGPDARLQLANDEAHRLLDLPADADGRALADLGLPTEVVAALTDDAVADGLFVVGGRVVAVSVADVAPGGARRPGRVVTLRDRTDLQRLTGELDSVQTLADALSSQAHESANRLHTVVSLVELGRGEEAVAFATEELRLVQGLTDQVVDAVEEPVVAAVLLGKSAVAAERGIDLVLDPATELDARVLEEAGVPARDLVTVLGNLVDNAVDAVSTVPPGAERSIEVSITVADDVLTLRVADSGPGLDPETASRAFRRGWSSKRAGPDRLHGRGLGLAMVGQTVTRLGGSVQVEQDGGAVFVVRVPLARPLPAAGRP